jgi:uncharacterized membrane protein YgcG
MRRIILSTAFLGFAAIAQAQSSMAGWSAFAGCWTPVSSDGSRNVAANTPRVCVLPDAANGADLLTVVSDSITDRMHVSADGRQHDVSKQGCNGWEKAEFSADGRRVYLKSEQTCAGGIKRGTSGVFAIATNGDWLSVVDVSADSASNVRVTRYASTVVPPTAPASIRDALAASEMSDRTARVAAQRDVSLNAVIEASRFISAPATEAWLSELEQSFNLDDKALIRLADERVPESVIDMMVAVSNPSVFSVRPTGSIVREEEERMNDRDRSYSPCFSPIVDPWAWYAYDPCDPFLRYGYYRSRYSRYYGSRYGYDPYYGYGGYYGGGYYGAPVVIVRGAETPKGRMTKDGYKRDDASTSSGTSTPRATTSKSGGSSSSGSASSGGSSSSGSSGSSSSGSSGSSGGSSSSGRTATRKPPA